MDFKELNLYKAEHYATSESGGEREPRDRAVDWNETKPTQSFAIGPD